MFWNKYVGFGVYSCLKKEIIYIKGETLESLFQFYFTIF